MAKENKPLVLLAIIKEKTRVIVRNDRLDLMTWSSVSDIQSWIDSVEGRQMLKGATQLVAVNVSAGKSRVLDV